MNEVYFDEALQPFLDEGWIVGVQHAIRSGKEATVYLCDGAPKSGATRLAAKVYHPLASRAFRNDSVYFEGRGVGNARNQRAFAKKTGFGKEVQFGVWVYSEFDMLRRLHKAGADVPRPIAIAASALLMELVADDDGEPAPQLRRFAPEPDEAEQMLDRLLRNIALFLALNVVHGDLSPYNILIAARGPVVIDFPQSIDPRSHSMALDLLRRDVQNVCDYFARFGAEADVEAIVGDMWTAFKFQALVPEL